MTAKTAATAATPTSISTRAKRTKRSGISARHRGLWSRHERHPVSLAGWPDSCAPLPMRLPHRRQGPALRQVLRVRSQGADAAGLQRGRRSQGR
eukprot:scaffold84_cov162-Pinguiococcus_pyrenoidosus.AAC.4